MKLVAFACFALTPLLPAQVITQTFHGAAAGDEFGTALAWVANRLAIGAPAGTSFGPSNSGTVTVEQWTGTGWVPGLFAPLPGVSTGDRFGAALAAIPADVGGPPRLLIGSPMHTSLTGATSGRADIIDVTTGVALTPSPINGQGADHQAGHRVVWAGDVDADGANDFMARSPRAIAYGCTCRSQTFWGGRVRVFDRLGLTGTVDGVQRCQARSGSCTFGLSGCTRNDRIGHAIARFGDIDGVPGDEILISAHPASYGGCTGERVLVYSWDSANGTFAQLRVDSMPAQVNALVSLGDVSCPPDGIPDYAAGMDGRVQIMDGAMPNTIIRVIRRSGGVLGRTLANIGDQDGDGVDDLLVGDPAINSDTGQVLVFSGLTGHFLHWFHGPTPSGRFGDSLIALDDLTGDGKPEFAVGAPNANGNTGEVHILTLDDQAQGRTGLGCAPMADPSICNPMTQPGCNVTQPLCIEPLIGTPRGSAKVTNANFTINVTRAPVGAPAYLFLGFQQFNPALDLGLFFPQMTGCLLYPNGRSFGPLQTLTLDPANTSSAQGYAQFPLDLSAAPIGFTFYVQWYVVTPGPFPVPAVLSKPMTVTIGC